MNDLYIKQIIPAPDNMYAVYNVDGELFEDKIICLALLSDDVIEFICTDEFGNINEVNNEDEQFVRIIYK